MTEYRYRFTGKDADALWDVRKNGLGDPHIHAVKLGQFLNEKKILSHLENTFTNDTMVLYPFFHLQRDGVSRDVTINFTEMGTEKKELAEALDRFKRGAETYRML